jgi:hypothetical protein
MTVWDRVRNVDIARKHNRGVPPIGFLDDADLLDDEAIRNWAMQVDLDKSQLGQQQITSYYWRLLELGKQQRFELPKLFKAWESMSKLLKSLPTPVQLLNRLLQHLTWYKRKAWEILFGIRQSIKLIDFGGEPFSRPHDVLMMDRTPVYQTLAAIAPIFYLPYSIVIGIAANIHLLHQLLLLSGMGIDAIAVVKGQHPSIIARLLELAFVVNISKAVLEARDLKPNYSINLCLLVEKY